jgi:hypothetical protein
MKTIATLRGLWLSGLIVLCGTVQAALAQGNRGEPCIRFLDDLFRPRANSARENPYEEPIETDRHDFTQSARTVGRGVVQLEAGYSYYYKDTGHEIEHAHAMPEMLWRWGVTDDIEFRLRWNYVWLFADEEEARGSAEDLRWGFKLHVTEQERWFPESALEIRSTAPTGGATWTTDRVEFGSDYIYTWELAERWTLSGSTGFWTNGGGEFSLQPEPDEKDDFMLWSQSVALGFPMGGRMTGYVEYYGLFTHARFEELRQHFFDVGVDFLVTNNLVFDLRLTKGLSDDADDLIVGIGGGCRF